MNHPCKVWALCLMTRPRQLHEMSLVLVILVKFLHVVYNQHSTGFNLLVLQTQVYTHRTWLAPEGLAKAEPPERLPAERGESESDYHENVSLLQVRVSVEISLTIDVVNEGTFSLAMIWASDREILFISFCIERPCLKILLGLGQLLSVKEYGNGIEQHHDH